MEEIWRDIRGFEGSYQVSDLGHFRSLPRTKIDKRGRIYQLKGKNIKTHKSNKHGHMNVRLGQTPCFAVHRLVLEAFVGPCPEGMEACHNNRDPSDNRAINLRWDTHKNNLEDRRRHGTMPQGVRNGNNNGLTDSKVRKIRRLAASGKYKQTELAKMFKTDQTNISLIVKCKSWKHVR